MAQRTGDFIRELQAQTQPRAGRPGPFAHWAPSRLSLTPWRRNPLFRWPVRLGPERTPKPWRERTTAAYGTGERTRCALLHHQFETIHPFLDGNGRLGRLFIVLYLTDRGRLPAPLLYLSSYFDRRKSDYYDRLQYVRERGQITEWLQFFLNGVAVQAIDAVERAEQLSDLREDYRSRLQGGGRAHLVVDLLFSNPILTVRHVMSRLEVSQPGAANLLRKLGAQGIVQEVGKGPGVRHRWVCHDVLKILDPESGS